MRIIYIFFVLGICVFLVRCTNILKSKDFPLFLQQDVTEGGVVCLKMIAQYYGRDIDQKKLETLAEKDDIYGITMLNISKAADSIGLHNLGTQISFERLTDDIPLPAIVHWENNHFVVVYKVNNKQAWVADPNPLVGKIIYTKSDFCKGWYSSHDTQAGVILLFETTNKFFKQKKIPE